VRVACEQAMRRSKVRGAPPVLTIVHKANVLKLTDGLFRECALKITAEFPEIEVNELLVDSAAMKLVKSPQSIDVLVTTNLFGDILSDEASALVGGLGVAPSANLGMGTPVFEPVHGSAPDIAGQGIANPVGALLSSAMMLETLSEPDAAGRLRQAVLDTLASGVCTTDLGGTATTREFTQAVSDQLK
jgi:homoisocitrate dehydrogenase